jgi:hypothetical protein
MSFYIISDAAKIEDRRIMRERRKKVGLYLSQSSA